ncbi:hypothetical protein DW322_07065 [Rhodococcus rhodnii]|uniref:Secreted protein n=2 Tax=Rhodococcus rhodnii TaxID=38312 RepID=R7WN27_9NOCA|nr:hypothetical protein Rrhod_1932 [Rhodococcus rhodnii LMG 5362]TXG90016.1 hypothetical protein DW322_07065 [Rhodococcus rhodnii]
MAGVLAAATAATAVGFAAPATAATATCPVGFECPADPPPCPYEWKFVWGQFRFVWQQQSYCLDERAVSTPERDAQRARQQAYNEGHAY